MRKASYRAAGAWGLNAVPWSRPHPRGTKINRGLTLRLVQQTGARHPEREVQSREVESCDRSSYMPKPPVAIKATAPTVVV
jgi:hypothetical protein